MRFEQAYRPHYIQRMHVSYSVALSVFRFLLTCKVNTKLQVNNPNVAVKHSLTPRATVF
jgi:hypothetical protein